MTNLLNEAWAEGIVTVVAAGNEGPHGTTDRTTPQRLGTPNNPLITVGGIFDDGSIWDQSTRQGTVQIAPYNPTLVSEIRANSLPFDLAVGIYHRLLAFIRCYLSRFPERGWISAGQRDELCFAPGRGAGGILHVHSQSIPAVFRERSSRGTASRERLVRLALHKSCRSCETR
jgi:hypothetical protein